MPEKNQQESNESQIDKIVLGAIIGTAIGSAIGLSVAPKKGSETRSEAVQLTKETASGLFKIAKRLLFGKKDKPKQ